MKSKSLVLVAIVAALPGIANAQAKAAPSAPPPSTGGICASATTRIESLQMDLAQLRADEIGDDSAPRATMRAAQATAKFTEAQVLLTQMTQAKCAAYPDAIGGLRYLAPAMNCRTAQLKFKSGDTLEECKTSTWKPG